MGSGRCDPKEGRRGGANPRDRLDHVFKKMSNPMDSRNLRDRVCAPHKEPT